MLGHTRGIVLRKVKYGDSGLIVTVLTVDLGVRSFLVRGMKAGTKTGARAGAFQHGMQLEIGYFDSGQKTMLRLTEFQLLRVYMSLTEDVIKNTVLMFASELLLRLLPENAPMPAIFDSATRFLDDLDAVPTAGVGNFPLFFAMTCGRLLGYEFSGAFSEDTPYPDLSDGGFSSHPPAEGYMMNFTEAQALSALLASRRVTDLQYISLPGHTRNKLLDWYLVFLERHTQHMGSMRSLPVLRALLA